jgi:hypothetical protein
MIKIVAQRFICPPQWVITLGALLMSAMGGKRTKGYCGGKPTTSLYAPALAMNNQTATIAQ